MHITKQTKIAVLCGGISSEREISLRSGNNCFSALQRLGYSNSLLVDIKDINDIVALKEKNIEAAFLITHGKFGEDGTIQGILEWLRIPYTGSSVLGSAISMDKWLTKRIAISANILTPKAFLLTRLNKEVVKTKKLWDELKGENNAVFIKPRDSGSSVNTFKIKSSEELEHRINNVDLDDSDYLIEEFISGREITVSMLEIDNKIKVLPILELKPKNEFYDYQAKYTKGMTEFILPAKLDQHTLEELESNSIKLFTTACCSSFGRVDYILYSENEPYLLEINSLPGMTDTSDLPAQAKCAGIEYDEIVEIVLKSARLHK